MIFLKLFSCLEFPLVSSVSKTNSQLVTYRKIPKISARAYIFQRPFLRGFSMEGNLHFKIDWASLIYSWKEMYRFCFVLLCIWRQFPSTSSRGAYIWRGNLTEGFLHYQFGGLIFGGAYFLNFKVPVAAHECTLASLTAENRFSGKGKWEARIMGSCRR